MEYFMLKQEKHYMYKPQIINWFGKIDVRDLCPERMKNIPEHPIFEIVSNKDTDFFDVILSPFFIVSKRMMKLIKLAQIGVKFVDCVLVDPKNDLQDMYYFVLPPEINCLAEESILSLDRSVIKKAVLDESKIKDHYIFKLGGVKNSYYVVNLNFAEMMLSETTKGLEFEPLETIQNPLNSYYE